MVPTLVSHMVCNTTSEKTVPREPSLGLEPIDPRLSRQVSLPTPIGPRLSRQVSPTMAPGAPRARGIIIVCYYHYSYYYLTPKHQPIQDLTRFGPKARRITLTPFLLLRRAWPARASGMGESTEGHMQHATEHR